jgi:hypothetical protein
MEVLYVPWVVQWFSILRSQEDTSRATYLGHAKGALPDGGELVSSFSSEHSSEHQIIHLELSAAHEPLLASFECLAFLIADCNLLSSMRSISSHQSWSYAASSYACTRREPMVTSEGRTASAL